jgi:ribonucleoside-diphosphate reductase alpha chain
MQLGVPYDSDKGRAIAAALTSIIVPATPTRPSAEIGRDEGAVRGYAKNREPMLRVMNMHRDAAYATRSRRLPRRISTRRRARTGTTRVRLGESCGYRNAQATVLAPTGTIGLLMDCDTTGIEPDFALVKFKKLAGGGYFKMRQPVGARARCASLGYDAGARCEEIVAYVSGTNTLLGAPHINRAHAHAKGLDRRRDIATGRSARSPASSTSTARSRAGSSARSRAQRLGVTARTREAGFDLPRAPRLHAGADRRGERRHRRLA